MYCLRHAAELECTAKEAHRSPGASNWSVEESTALEPTHCWERLTGVLTSSRGKTATQKKMKSGVSTVRVKGEEEDLAELESLESGEHRREADRYCISTCMWKDDSLLVLDLVLFCVFVFYLV
jgi:hypothetical protein